jgi:two-component system, NtrC family, sensor kinase
MKNQNYSIFFLLKCVFIVFSFFVHPLSTKAQDTLTYTADQTLMDIGQHVLFYKDPSNTLNLEQIKNLPDAAFQKSASPILKLGHTTANTWLKIVLKNQTDVPLFLVFQTNVINQLDAFIYDEAGKLTTKQSGIERPFVKRDLNRSQNVINIGQSPKVVYAKMNSKYPFHLPLVVGRLEYLADDYQIRDVINGLTVGILVAMALYNLFLFFSVKDRLYLYYCIYMFTSLWMVLHFTSIAWLIWNKNPLPLRIVGVPYVLLSAWLFTVRFLNLDKDMPRTYTAIKILCVLIACVIPLELFELHIQRTSLQQFLVPISAFSMLGVGIYSHFQGNKSAKYYVVAWAFLMTGAIITSFTFAGLIPFNNFTYAAVLYGAFAESILLAFALANRINIYRAESAQAQSLAFQRLEENERLVKEQNKLLEEKVHERTLALETSLQDLKATQAQLVQSEKLASLGELTAGIAHEIQNPLNFVNNFSELSVDLADELEDEIKNPNLDRDIIIELSKDIKNNQKKINHHGQRASNIVKGMLEHSRASTGVKELTDMNKLADEYLRLSYHGMRAKDNSFNADFKTNFDENLPKIEVIPQDMGRVLLNLINNAFYAVKPPTPPKGGVTSLR